MDGWGSINAYNFVLAQESTGEVTFTESGVPSGTKWFVNLSNGQSLSSTAASISTLLQDGTYSYTASVPQAGYNFPTGSFSVSGSPENIIVTFAYSTYRVSFTETGLPTGNWYVNTSSESFKASYGNPISFNLPNGTYGYTVATDYKNYAPKTGSGTFTISGADTAIPQITFSPVEYAISFSESGLPASYQWEIDLNGASYRSGTGTFITSLQNGTYSYTALSLSNNSYSSQGGSLTVHGSALSIPVVFKEAFHIYFSESGLPQGVKWSVNLNGAANTSVTPGDIGYALPNGTYKYYIPGTPGYHPLVSSGTVNIDGNSQTIAEIFVVTTYNAVFTPYGLPSGTSWYVNFTSGPGTYGNERLFSSGNSLSLQLPNGTYSYVVASSDKKYEASGSAFTIQGYGTYTSVYFNPVTYAVSFHEDGLPSGMNWNISINGIRYEASSDTQIIHEVNGTYTYQMSGPAGYHPVVNNGEFAINGAPQSINVISQAYTYNITLSEDNLPRATEWWVNLTNGMSFNTTNSTMNGSLSNGTYYFYAGTSNKSWINTNSYFGYGKYKLIVVGYPYTYSISFMLMTYNITIFESGLSPGAQWEGYVPDSYGFYGGTSRSASAFLPNGTFEFNFTAWQNGVEYEPTTMNITVNGVNSTYYIAFHRYYTITFEEVGLPAGQNSFYWGVNFSGVSFSTNSEIEVNASAIDGIYRAMPINNSLYYGVLSNDLVTVHGSNLTVMVKYEPYAFITLSIQPENATVMIDGIRENPLYGYLNVSLLPGNHSIVVYENGYTTYYKNTTLSGGKAIHLQVSLQPPANAKAFREGIFAAIAAAIGISSIVTVSYVIRKRR